MHNFGIPGGPIAALTKDIEEARSSPRCCWSCTGDWNFGEPDAPTLRTGPRGQTRAGRDAPGGAAGRGSFAPLSGSHMDARLYAFSGAPDDRTAAPQPSIDEARRSRSPRREEEEEEESLHDDLTESDITAMNDLGSMGRERRGFREAECQPPSRQPSRQHPQEAAAAASPPKSNQQRGQPPGGQRPQAGSSGYAQQQELRSFMQNLRGAMYSIAQKQDRQHTMSDGLSRQ